MMPKSLLDRMLRDNLRDLNRPRRHHTNQSEIMVDVTCPLQDSRDASNVPGDPRHVCTLVPNTPGEQTRLPADPLPVAGARTGLLMDRPEPVDTDTWMIPSYRFQERDTGSSRDRSATIRWSFWSTRDHR